MHVLNCVCGSTSVSSSALPSAWGDKHLCGWWQDQRLCMIHLMHMRCLHALYVYHAVVFMMLF